MAKQTKLTKAARGQECTIQLFPYCNGNPETTVFCHAPSEAKGMGIKSPDWWGADGCSDCHDIVDGRRNVDVSNDEVQRCFTRGIFKTIERRIEAGLIAV